MTGTPTLRPPLVPTSSSVDPMRACRFCLRNPSSSGDDRITMRALPVELLANTDIPYIFEMVTAVKLDLTGGYSELLCTDCEQRMRAAASTRADLLRVVQQWQKILHGVLDVAKQSSAQLLKTESSGGGPAGGLLAEDGADFQAQFVECELGVVKQETPSGDVDDDNSGDSSDDREANAETDADADGSFNWKTLLIGAADAAADEYDESGSDNDDDEPLARKYRQKEHTNHRQQSNSARSSLLRRSAKMPPPVRPGRKPAVDRPQAGEPLTCDICNAQLYSRHMLITHMRKEHESKPDAADSTCQICGKTGLKSMVHHMRVHRRADQYKCAHCPKTFFSAELHQQHERTHTGEKPFICEMCGFSFTASSGLRRHMKLRHNGNLATLVQRPLKQQIVRRRVLPPDADAATVLPKLPPVSHADRLQCPLCPNTYANRPSMHPHMKIQHGAEGVAEWKLFLATVCAVCGVRCADAEALSAHRVVHQPYQCEICRRRFDSRSTWELHVQKHGNKERRHKCTVCEARFPCSFSLRMHHRRAHTDYRPFPCPQCGLAFAENAEMMAHMRKRHTTGRTQRSHPCDLCPPGTPAFKTRESLRSHMENHTGQYRYQCKVCLRRKSSAVELLDHMRGYHPAELKAMDEENARQAEELAREMAAASAVAEATTAASAASFVSCRWAE